MSGHYTAELKHYEDGLRELIAGDLARLNEQARKLNVPTILVPEAREKAKKPGAVPPGK